MSSPPDSYAQKELDAHGEKGSAGLLKHLGAAFILWCYEQAGTPTLDSSRGRTIAREDMLREQRRLRARGLLPEILEYERPQSRLDCREGQRPCPYVACRYHLYLDVHPRTGSIKLNFPDKEADELAETCALDVAERGGVTLEEVGAIMNLTRERIRQVEASAMDKLRVDADDLGALLEE